MHKETNAGRRVAISLRAIAHRFFLVALLISTPWILARSGNAFSEPGAGESKDQQVTLVGCARRGVSWFLSAADLKEYALTGDLGKLEGSPVYVQISGTRISADAIKVAAVKELPDPNAKLSPAIAKSSDWRKYADQAHGIAYSLPAAFPLWRYGDEQPFETKFVDKKNVATLAKFEIPRDAWGNSNFVGGELAIYATSRISGTAGCYELQESDADEDHSSELIHGVRYVHDQESSIPPEEFDFYRAFQNGRCYEIVFDFSFDRIGAMDRGCMVPIMDPDSLIKPILSGISFFKPEQAKTAASTLSATP